MKGKISSLPMSMSAESTSLLRMEKWLKFPIGPTALRPGPTLPMQVNTEVTVVSIS